MTAGVAPAEAEVDRLMRHTLPAEWDDLRALVEWAVADVPHPATRLRVWEAVAELAALRIELTGHEVERATATALPLGPAR